MKTAALVMAVLIVMPLSTGFANELSLDKAYSLLYQGKINEAISLVEEYVEDTPDVRAYYFLGYAYYEKQDMEVSMKYFKEAYKMKSFYSPSKGKKH
ncbi:MAG: hypothetical protein AMK70_12345 [Nitrospira bacterium SG8_35_1]|jgi:TolA-binding protein|nr:MAG: hypothetical protein AMK70_12345 [Nitrospira bacterium SG8_35_1]